MSDISLLLLIVLATIGLFIWNRLPLVVVAMGSALSLYLTGILSLDHIFVGFGDPVVVFVAALFIVTAGLEATGVTAWMGQQFERLVAGSSRRLLVIGMLAVAALCPLINSSGAIGTLMPVVMLIAVRLREQPSQFLLPMAFSSGAGSHLALTGAPKNVLIANSALDYTGHAIGFFEFAWAGVPLLAGTIVIVLLLRSRLVPARIAPRLPRDLRRHAETLVQQYRLTSDTFVLGPVRGSALVGTRVEELPLEGGLRLISVIGPAGTPRRREELRASDRLVVRGSSEKAHDFASRQGLKVVALSGAEAAGGLIDRSTGVVEAVIPLRSSLIGQPIFPGMAITPGDLVVMAIQRHGENLIGEVTLHAGDHLLIQGPWTALRQYEAREGVLIVDRSDSVRRQLVPLGVGANAMLLIVAAMVIAIASGALAPSVAAVLAAGAILLLNLLSVEDAFRAINWTTVVLIAAMFPLSAALVETGAAQLIAHHVVEVVGAASPRLLLAMIFILAVVMGIVVSNTATTMILLPVAVMAANAFGVSPLPAIMALSVATSASFLTPVSTTSNTMVMGPAGYRFSDYWPLGLPLTVWYFVVAVWLVPLIWPF